MRIERYHVLNKYFLSLFGAKDFLDIAIKLKDKEWGFDSIGRSYFVNALIGNSKIPEEQLILYDKNIQAVVEKINQKREPKFLPKYFQYLALLFTEIFLDNLKNNKREFLVNLNQFLENYKKENEIGVIEKFEEEDLKKLAFWMATGSGKTLIAHANYYQFLNYGLFSPDNIIFITPNEGLSKQHKEELEKSGIPARLYMEGGGGLFSKRENEVLVIEITKFVEEKRGGGVTLPVEAFEGKNLLFVDEGHKGRRTEEQKWAKLRKELAKDGFVFEYSATFGQILSEKNKEVLEEYGKSIIFDYSYKYFYLDGYGKDFSILNVKEKKISDKKFQEIMFVANLLSFFEQLLVFEENKSLVREYNLEKPLWIFVGTTVIKGKSNTSEEKELISDVLQIVKFFQKANSEKEWLRNLVEKILNGKTGLKDEKGEEIFKEKFKFLRERKIDFEKLFEVVFNGKGNFRIFEIKNAEGELGLKLGENDYFGVINIGNVSDFKKEVQAKLKTEIEEDVISSSLFENIKKENSPINVLIGAKKFIEGWDTWRVTSMGLLNIGKGQGPQIIQLFGRGVRLKGKNMSLKRSDREEIKILEILNIYGIKADYLNKFLDAIRKEEVDFEVIEIQVHPRHKEKWSKLFVPIKDEKRVFEEETILRLREDPTIKVEIDLTPKIEKEYSLEERKELPRQEKIEVEKTQVKIKDDFNLFDWQKLHCEILDYKITKGYWNLVFGTKDLKNLVLKEKVNFFSLKPFSDYSLKEKEEILLLGLKKYIDQFQKKANKKFDTENLKYVTLNKTQLPLLREGKYVLQIKKSEGGKLVNQELIKKIKDLTKDLEKLLNEENDNLPRVYFDHHLFLPILIKTKKIDKIFPEGLEESEVKFLKKLREYLIVHKNNLKNSEIYVLRNFPERGIGFALKWSNFYPDFILWKKEKNKQSIIFIDPHGLIHSRDLNDEKIQFKKTLCERAPNLKTENIKLDAFIISPTSYDMLIKNTEKIISKEEYKSNGVLFLEDENWPEEILKDT